MFDFFFELEWSLLIPLIFSLLLVLAFEFVNGFHDTANAVATVIYTKAMKPTHAVILSGIFNFFGVLFGGLAVAYAIVNLLPMDLLINMNSSKGLITVFSLLASALIWNLGTWYFGIPASSSHTLIGSILGVGLANAWITKHSITEGVNWGKAIDVFLSLLLSPIIGGGLAGLLLLFLLKWKPNSNMHRTPYKKSDPSKRKKPPFWIRFTLVCSAMGLSFSHGSNDGQKGVGLFMLVLFSLVPAHFVVNMHSTRLEIEQTKIAAVHLKDFYNQYQEIIKAADLKSQDFIISEDKDKTHDYSYTCSPFETLNHIESLTGRLNKVNSYNELDAHKRWQVRNDIMCLGGIIKQFRKIDAIPSKERVALKTVYKSLSHTTQYAPIWAIIIVATALGLGTMVGWRRIVETVGEKIGKKDMTYAQGMSAQIMTGASIGLASFLGFPVSTTHILSSSVAGTMIVNRSGLQKKTIKTILTAWVFTLPVTIAISFTLFWTCAKLFS